MDKNRRLIKDKGKKELLKSIHIPTRKELGNDKRIVFSFLHFCKNQGATFEEWNEEGKLCKAFEILENYSKKYIRDEDKTYAIYGDFPPNTDFVHPSNVPDDACWARFHVDGQHIIAGHIVNNVFYVVFLDSNHKFWIISKK